MNIETVTKDEALRVRLPASLMTQLRQYALEHDRTISVTVREILADKLIVRKRGRDRR
jgi:hypothetical protein